MESSVFGMNIIHFVNLKLVKISHKHLILMLNVKILLIIALQQELVVLLYLYALHI